MAVAANMITNENAIVMRILIRETKGATTTTTKRTEMYLPIAIAENGRTRQTRNVFNCRVISFPRWRRGAMTMTVTILLPPRRRRRRKTRRDAIE